MGLPLWAHHGLRGLEEGGHLGTRTPGPSTGLKSLPKGEPALSGSPYVGPPWGVPVVGGEGI